MATLCSSGEQLSRHFLRRPTSACSGARAARSFRFPLTPSRAPADACRWAAEANLLDSADPFLVQHALHKEHISSAMKQLLAIASVPVIALILGVSASAFGQGGTRPPNTDLVKRDGRVNVLYHRSEDRTAVNLAFFPLFSDRSGRIELATEYSVRGQTISLPQVVEIWFTSHSSMARFSPGSFLELKCAEKAFRYSPDRYVSIEDSFDGSETVHYAIPFSDFVAIANCESPEFVVDALRVPLSPDLHNSYRAMVRMVPT